jgi:surface carbohydrate biosynthesis protein
MKLREILSIIRFANPEQNDIAIIYPQDSWIRQFILKELNSTTLALYPVCVHITPLIIVRTLLRLSRICWSSTHGEERFLKNLARQIYAQYILACVDQVKAKIVLTNIDNSSMFQYLSRLDAERTYYAIQNGTRTLFCARDSLPHPPHPFSQISMTNLFCFGQRDVELFSRFGHKIDNCFPVGSLIGGYFKSVVAAPSVKPQFDLCLISQWHEHLFGEIVESGIEADMSRRVSAGIRDLNRYLLKLLDETVLSLVICPRNDDEAELAFYDQLFSGRATIVKPDRANFSTYRAIEQSRLAVALNSTTLAEAFAWGQKVLWCNIPRDEHYEMPEAGISYFEGDDYAVFKERVLMIIDMPQREYEQQTKAMARHINCYDPAQPPHEIIRSTVVRELSGTT